MKRATGQPEAALQPETPPTRSAAAPREVRRRSQTSAPRSAGGEEDIVLAPALSGVVGYLLRRAHNAFQSYWMAKFRASETPITPVQGGMLVVLGANPGLTQTELARMMKVEGPTLMQSIDRLEEQGYVQRARRAGDRRSYSLQLTPRGHEALGMIDRFLPMRDAALLTDLTPEEVTVLAGLLTKIVTRAHLRLKELQKEGAQAQDPDARAGPKKPRRAAVS